MSASLLEVFSWESPPEELLEGIQRCGMLVEAQYEAMRVGSLPLSLSSSNVYSHNASAHVPCVTDFIRNRLLARGLRRATPDGRLVHEQAALNGHKVAPCRTLRDVNPLLLKSGVAVFLGVMDGYAVVALFCNQQHWNPEQLSHTELARLLLYYSSIPSIEVRNRGLSLIADVRGSTQAILNQLLEALYAVHTSQSGAVGVVHMVADKHSQSLLFSSSVFKPNVNLKIDLVMGIGSLYKVIHQNKLPPALGGISPHNHHHWVHFRMNLEVFLSKCRRACHALLEFMQDLTFKSDLRPNSQDEIEELVQQQEIGVAKALQDPSLQELEQVGEELLAELQEQAELPGVTTDFREGVRAAERLYQETEVTKDKLLSLSKDTQHKLHTCLRLQEITSECSQVLSWLGEEGEDGLARYAVIADNLKGIRAQQRDFDSFYFQAKTEVERGNGVVEEVSHLCQTQDLDQVRDIWDMSKDLEMSLGKFTTRLETLRDRIDGTAKCYQLLDKAYEWALGAMKHVTSLKLPSGHTRVSDLDALLSALDLYIREHPPLPASLFDRMLDLSSKLCNDKLHEQCIIARDRCHETHQLLKVRQATLKKAKDQALLLEQTHGVKGKFRRSIACSGQTSDVVLEAETNGSNTLDETVVLRRKPTQKPSQWDAHSSRIKQSAVDSLLSVLRRRSYAGKPSTPMYCPMAAAFKENARDMNLSEYEEYLFNEGLITEDMSDRIVAFIPKGLSNIKGSQDNLMSYDNLSGSLDSLVGDDDDISTPSPQSQSVAADSPAKSPPSGQLSFLDNSDVALRLGLAQSRRQNMRKSQSVMIRPGGRHNALNSKPLSHLTASTESLPCTPEEADETYESEESSSLPTTPRRPTEAWSPAPSVFSRLSPSSQSMSDLRSTENDVKRRRTLSLIMQEMIETEQHYISSLHLVIDNYLPEMTKASLPQPLRGKRHVIFGNIEKIYEFHRQFFQAELEQCQDNPYQIGHIFMNHAPEFYLYALYNKNKPKSDAIIAEYGKTFFKQKQTELQDHLDLSSYLLKPVQRMGKYALLLKQVLQQCPESNPEHADLKAAVDMVKFQLRHGNDLLAMDSLRGCDVNLSEQGMLLRQEEFLVWHGRRKRYRRMFLFEDLMVFSKTRRASNGEEVYSYKNSIRTSELGLTENVGDTGCKFEVWFRKRQSGDAYILQAPTRDIKNSWVTDLSRLLWKQAIRNRERHKAESAHMGMGAKLGLDIQPSQNNISDRLVSFSLASKTSTLPMYRNTIAGSKGDRFHGNAFKRRPNSLISVTSSSSSSSSGYHSQHSGGSPQNLSVKVVASTPEVAETLSLPVSGHVGGSYMTAAPLDPPETKLAPNEVTRSPQSEDAFTQTTLRRRKTEANDDDTCIPLSNPSAESSSEA